MKFWKKSNGDCGTVDNAGFVPDSVEITKAEYDNFIASYPIIKPVDEITEFEDINTGKKYIMRKVK